MITISTIGFDISFLCGYICPIELCPLKEKGISVKELLSVIPDDILVQLSISTGVDYQVKKLYGRSVFYLLLYGLLDSRVSLRSLEDTFNSTKFKVLFNLDRCTTAKYNSISDRLTTLNEEYFKQLYELLYQNFSSLYNTKDGLKYNITRVDSTMVAEVANKLRDGMVVGKCKDDGPKQLKYTISLTNLFPSSVSVYTEQGYLSEDKAIPKAILCHVDKSKDNVFVFDRGVSSRKELSGMDNRGLQFVTRINPNARYEVIEHTSLTKKDFYESSLTILRDDRVVLFDKYNKRSNEFRLIQTEDNQGKPFWFMTNMIDEDPTIILAIYKRRWDIEVFFRFIKQELNFKHFISTSLNGIQIILYMTLILSMLILIYKKLNGIGYKTAVRRFHIEVDELIMSIIVTACGGDPKLVFR